MRKVGTHTAELVNGNEVMIYGDIGWQITAQDVVEALLSLRGQPITVAINSMGGSFFEAQAIYGALLRHGMSKVTVRVDSLAASAASYIAMAGGKVVMTKGSFMMVHAPRVSGFDLTQEDMERLVVQTAKVEDSMLDAYCEKSGMDRDEMRTLLRVDTWLDAKTCVEKGLADEIDEMVEAKAHTLTSYVTDIKVPANIAARVQYIPPKDKQDELRRRNLATARGAIQPPQAGPGADEVAKLNLHRQRHLKLLSLAPAGA